MTRNEKINAIVAHALENIEKYEDIQEAYEYNCEQYPENKSDANFLEQTIRDFLNVKNDIDIDVVYKTI